IPLPETVSRRDEHGEIVALGLDVLKPGYVRHLALHHVGHVHTAGEQGVRYFLRRQVEKRQAGVRQELAAYRLDSQQALHIYVRDKAEADIHVVLVELYLLERLYQAFDYPARVYGKVLARGRELYKATAPYEQLHTALVLQE